MSREVTCKICGSLFIDESRNQGRTICSERCRKAAKSEYEKAWREHRKVPRNDAKRVCPSCGKTFVSKANRATYCSHACNVWMRRQQRNAHRERNVPKQCTVCGKSYMDFTQSGRYCSPQCLAKGTNSSDKKRQMERISPRNSQSKKHKYRFHLDEILAEMRKQGYQGYEYGKYQKIRFREFDHTVLDSIKRNGGW